jgi:hypothetical protein
MAAVALAIAAGGAVKAAKTTSLLSGSSRQVARRSTAGWNLIEFGSRASGTRAPVGKRK